MHFDLFTLLPEVFPSYLNSSMMKRAQEKNLLSFGVHNIRDWTHDKHHVTDDYPYGGGGGMIMKPEPIFEAVEDVIGSPPDCPIILLTPQGRVFTQNEAQRLALEPKLALLCGRYEGVDERVRTHLVTDEISIGDYVLTGGELPALILIDALTRLIPGVLGDEKGAANDSHASGLLEGAHYTRPAKFRGWEVPAVLRSGDHAKVAQWRREQALLRTLERNPEMLSKIDLSKKDKVFLKAQKTSF
ncbi:MAG: tRNA (guanosine(37)-N1)-methyltransferase TrmD [Anaerolineae bacterium]|jgi:tRNA (guanine37-N1)-methyltransferase|nr:tRNA (guanosine(37)-N1)-methyltransferase TrmD [Anaerolineae bacterium]MBT7073345.1 tRNA (guanosine(37)-N1)-methyltransferase TrmD [Anaerolineae bacterium]MBT7783383.1 tRNA (guanosine(37)-N1)-methyltransferase TrmD [Anaerolineae bacterium]